MKTSVLTLLAALVLGASAAHAQNPTPVPVPVNNLNCLQDFFNLIGIPTKVVSSYDRGTSTPSKINGGHLCVNGPASAYNLVGGAQIKHPEMNGYLTAGTYWTYFGTDVQPVSAATGQSIYFRKADAGGYRNVQVASDGTSFLMFDTNNYSYKVLVSTSIVQNSDGTMSALLVLVPNP